MDGELLLVSKCGEGRGTHQGPTELNKYVRACEDGKETVIYGWVGDDLSFEIV
jgi:hypothetical protein